MFPKWLSWAWEKLNLLRWRSRSLQINQRCKALNSFFHTHTLALTIRYMAPEGITGFRPGTMDSSLKQISELDWERKRCKPVSLMQYATKWYKISHWAQLCEGTIIESCCSLIKTDSLPSGSRWCCCKSSEACCWGCSPGHLGQWCMHPKYAGSVSPNPDGSTEVTHTVSPDRNAGVICSKHREERRTAGPNTWFLSWIRIHPILHPGTSQRFAKPPQESMGTSLLRDAKEGELQPGKSCENSSRAEGEPPTTRWCVQKRRTSQKCNDMLEMTNWQNGESPKCTRLQPRATFSSLQTKKQKKK